MAIDFDKANFSIRGKRNGSTGINLVEEVETKRESSVIDGR